VVYHLGCGFSSGAGTLDLDWDWDWDWVHIAGWDSIRTLFFPTRWIYHLKPDFDFSGWAYLRNLDIFELISRGPNGTADTCARSQNGASSFRSHHTRLSFSLDAGRLPHH
jgi:hypothetical protein